MKYNFITNKKVILLILVSILLSIVIFAVLLFGPFIIEHIKYKPQVEKIELFNNNYIKAKLDYKYYPGQALIVFIYDKNNNCIYKTDMKAVVGNVKKYMDNKDDSWKKIKYIKENNGEKIYKAVWGYIILSKNGNITIKKEYSIE